MKKLTFLSIICSVVFISGCLGALKATTEFGVPAIKVAEGAAKAARPISDSEEYYLGRSVAANIMGLYKSYDDQNLLKYVNLVGKTAALNSKKPETFGGYHFAVLDSKEINAMACPGGIIFVTKGLVDLMTSEDELAAVLAHEIGHIINKDGVNAVKSSRWTQALAVLGSAAVQQYGSEGFGQLVGLFEGSVEDVVKTLVVNGYGRTQELEADKSATEILIASGYDPGALSRVLDYYRQREGSDNTGFFKTHPGSSERISNLEKNQARDIVLPNDARTLRFNRIILKH
ncbi:M48 family metallopeptidase [Desulforegula conservatrix]|uniref:M48 family metallopeptidase n=1 Tax=Desulforegula conservatrix TaxID=153026 RepID=UPI0004093C5C|nr:M48 family metallopeptidase [Desulforegula conservatrix]